MIIRKCRAAETHRRVLPVGAALRDLARHADGPPFVPNVAIAVALICAVAARASAQISSRVYASGFSSPVAFVQDPADRSVQFVVEQDGTDPRGSQRRRAADDFLDLAGAVAAGGERGLLGLAFAPDASSGRFFVNFTNTAGDTVVARFRRSADPLIADAASRFDLRWNGAGGAAFIAQPFANHNGGHLAFGPDGFLYIGLGDGGSGNDPAHRAQNPAELLGKMLRIDVNVPDGHPTGYQIPADNPFVRGGPAGVRAEIWAFGLRNPWRYSFDDPAPRRHRRAAHRRRRSGPVGGDRLRAGQSRRAQLRLAQPRRGAQQRHVAAAGVSAAHRSDSRIRPCGRPVDHRWVRVSRARARRGVPGPLFLRRFQRARLVDCARRIDGAGEARASDLTEHTSELGGRARLGNISSFGVDSDGELYIVSYSNGTILKMIGPPTAPPAPTGLRIVR